MKKILTFLSFLALAGCAVGPDFVRPLTFLKSDQHFLNTPLKNTDDQNAINRWWERIEDPLLQAYIDNLLKSNLDIKQATERMIQSRETANITSGAFFPTLGVDSSAGRSFSNPNVPLNDNRNYSSSFNAGLNTSWQIDLFGKIRRQQEAANANFQASIYDRQALIHALIADVLNRRVAISVLKEQRILAEKNTNNREKLYAIVDNRYDMGARQTSATDVLLAEENFKSVKADIHLFNRQIAENVYALDVLLGQIPGTSQPQEHGFPLIPDPFDIPTCLPADLLDRRPDLRASELRLKAANANIGVAVADLYPSLNLSGSLGFNSNETNNLFSAQQLAGSLLSSLTARLFEGGSLRANIRLRESEAREQTALYSQTILNALAEVETTLKNEEEIIEELKSQEDSVIALRKAENIAQQRYIRGIIPLRELLDIQQPLYLAEQSLLSLQQSMWNNRVALYLALGGDWLGEGATQNCINTIKQEGQKV